MVHVLDLSTLSVAKYCAFSAFCSDCWELHCKNKRFLELWKLFSFQGFVKSPLLTNLSFVKQNLDIVKGRVLCPEDSTELQNYT